MSSGAFDERARSRRFDAVSINFICCPRVSAGRRRLHENQNTKIRSENSGRSGFHRGV